MGQGREGVVYHAAVQPERGLVRRMRSPILYRALTHQSTLSLQTQVRSPRCTLAHRQLRRTLCLCSHSYAGIDMSEPRSGGVVAESGAKPEDYRLPTDVYPKVRHGRSCRIILCFCSSCKFSLVQHYDVAIKTNLHTSPPTFSGEVLVHLDVKADTSKITFNVHPSLKVSHLAISSTELKSTAAVVLPTSALSVNEEQERGVVDLASLPDGGLKAGASAKLWLRFDGELKGNMVGYYKSEGDADEAGKKQV